MFVFKVGSKYALYLMYTDDLYFQLSPEQRKIIFTKGYIFEDLFRIETIEYPTLHKRMSKNWSRMALWSFDQFDRIVYLDSDSIVVKNIDHLFDVPFPFSFMGASDEIPHLYLRSYLYGLRNVYQSNENPTWKLNAGLMVLIPSKKYYMI